MIGEKAPIAIRMAKECIMAADEMNLEQGLKYERRNFHALFATKDQKEVRRSTFLEHKMAHIPSYVLPFTINILTMHTLKHYIGNGCFP